jgi:hypothetical protein
MPKKDLLVSHPGNLVEGPQSHERPDELKAFRRLVIICAWCRKIRHSEGVWHEPQTDLQAHGGVRFSHGVCPECADRLYNAHRYRNIEVNLVNHA